MASTYREGYSRYADISDARNDEAAKANEQQRAAAARAARPAQQTYTPAEFAAELAKIPNGNAEKPTLVRARRKSGVLRAISKAAAVFSL